MHRVTNAFHGFIYFAPECRPHFAALGLEEHHDYFAARAAPMGPVPAEVVMATFYNFAPRRVRAALPQAWSIASPEDIQAARMKAAGERLTLAAGSVTPARIGEAIDICEQVVDSLEWGARPLAGANAAVALPKEPMLRLWQLVTIIREWRGDAHVAALAAAALDPLGCLIAHAATGQVPRSALQESRGWTDSEWAAGIERLVARGWCEADGSFTPLGAEARAAVETTTDVLSAPMWADRADQAQTLLATLKPLSASIWKDMPMPSWTKPRQ